MSSSSEDFKGYACNCKGGQFEAFSYAPPKLGDNDIEIEITHCGICHSDIHFIDNLAGISQYPMVAGHEIIGIVKAKGPLVENISLGDRVGVGTQTNSCLDYKNCINCRHGNEQYCSQIQYVFNSPLPENQIARGGFQQKIRCSSNFAFKIPDSISSAEGAPLLCAGNTVYPPLARYGAGSLRKKVGIVGMGGLGHLAIQFASKMGAEVTVISTSDSKKNDAFKYGAHYFVNSNNSEEMQKLSNTLDLIINTVSEIEDLSQLINILNMDGVIVLVALNLSVKLPTLAAIFTKRLTITTSFIASRQEGQDMFDFAARNNIKSEVQVIPMKEINEGIAMVRENRARYRVVVANEMNL